MYRNILIAVDGSHTSELALQEAITLAKELQGKLRIVHAVEYVALSRDMEYIDPRQIWDAQIKAGRTLLAKAENAARAAGVEAETKLIEIDPLGQRIPQVIAQDAEAWPAALIVLGIHGRRGLSHLFLGSVAEGVVRVASKPVLLIRGT